MSTTPEREVAAHIRAMFAHFTEHRPDQIEASLHQDCTVWDVFVPELIMGKENRVRYHAADQAQSQARGPLTLTVDEPVTTVWGDTALARYYVRFKYEPPNAVEGVVRITSVLRRENGRWLIVHHHEGMLPGGVPPTNERA
jgi:ketosteroid isomerase-like protein